LVKRSFASSQVNGRLAIIWGERLELSGGWRGGVEDASYLSAGQGEKGNHLLRGVMQPNHFLFETGKAASQLDMRKIELAPRKEREAQRGGGEYFGRANATKGACPKVTKILHCRDYAEEIQAVNHLWA
jgi:hypothetical protein